MGEQQPVMQQQTIKIKLDFIVNLDRNDKCTVAQVPPAVVLN
jgi:hypothetical protein